MKKFLLVFVLMLMLSISTVSNVFGAGGAFPVFTAPLTYNYNIGDVEPVWVDLVVVNDVEDGVIVPVVDSSAFVNNSAGWNDVIYTATDLDLNVTIYTLKVQTVCEFDCALLELADVSTGVPVVIVSGIESMSLALISSAVVIFAVALALVFRGFKLIPRVIKSLRG